MWAPSILSVSLWLRIFTRPSVSALVLARLLAAKGNLPTLNGTPCRGEERTQTEVKWHRNIRFKCCTFHTLFPSYRTLHGCHVCHLYNINKHKQSGWNLSFGLDLDWNVGKYHHQVADVNVWSSLVFTETHIYFLLIYAAWLLCAWPLLRWFSDISFSCPRRTMLHPESWLSIVLEANTFPAFTSSLSCSSLLPTQATSGCV